MMKHVSWVAFAIMANWSGSLLAQEDWMARGARLAKARAYPKALEAFREAIRQDPQELDGYFNAGNIALNLKQCKEALLYFRGFLYLSPGTKDDKTAKAGMESCEAKNNVGTVTVKSEPQGIEVLIDGALVGKTPLAEVKLTAGTYPVIIRHPDYDEWRGEVMVTAGQVAEVSTTLKRKAAFGFLEVKTVPEGARVFLDEREIGVTPMEKQRLETRKYLIRFEKQGFDKWVRYVTIAKEKTTSVNATLERLEPVDPVDR